VYCPYFRGKQYELIALRENASLIARSRFLPIIEPVRANMAQLGKAVDALATGGAEAVIVVNPTYGDFRDASEALDTFIRQKLEAYELIRPGILITNACEEEATLGLVDRYLERRPVIIHDGYTRGKDLADGLKARSGDILHAFIDGNCTDLYQLHFKDYKRVLIRDGFIRKVNRTYSPVESFSDLHLTYDSIKGLSGFGDFLIVGDDYQEEGGPAYAVAIHLTFIDPKQENTMMIYHFISERKDSPADPAGKFAEALERLYAQATAKGSPLLRTSAVEEFLGLRERGHFPGLGYVKKLSMQHHLELMAGFLTQR
jgi:hypothetical protein